MADRVCCVEPNNCGSLSRNDSITDRDSVSDTSKSYGIGKYGCSRSETISICGSLDEALIKEVSKKVGKKYKQYR